MLSRQGHVERGAAGADAVPQVGDWYNLRQRDWQGNVEVSLCCVVHVGSNYVELEGVNRSSTRVHLDQLDGVAERVDPEPIIAGALGEAEGRLRGLLGEVQELTARLALAPRPGQLDGGETQALALRGGSQPVEEYKTALATAKEKTLPELFKAIESEHETLALWMKARLIPMKARAAEMRPVIKAIEGRIFNVELYAGLTEQVEQIADGKPAPTETPVHLFQRRAYMDEECLLDYQTGGMELNGIGGFDRWLLKPANLARLLPFPRCALAFRVRRREKERVAGSLSDFIAISNLAQGDRATFLYMRNGEKVFRLTTEIDFGAQLFPDLGSEPLKGPFYAEVFGDRVERVVGASQYAGILAEKRERQRERRRRAKAWKKLSKKEREERWDESPDRVHFNSFDRWEKYTRRSVYYDDITEHLRAQADAHNRLVLVLQGILDRSPTFHPHPPWQLWRPESFEKAIVPVYDQSRALSPGDAPDFEAYRAELNESLAVGSWTVGQEEVWERAEAVKENARRRRGDWAVERYRPYGNPGPGLVAEVKQLSRSRGATFRWTRERVGRRAWWKDQTGEVGCQLVVPVGELLNVSAYRPGDFKQFYEDPRTRADYLKWAPLLLAAEEWHAGNRKGRPQEE